MNGKLPVYVRKYDGTGRYELRMKNQLIYKGDYVACLAHLRRLGGVGYRITACPILA